MLTLKDKSDVNVPFSRYRIEGANAVYISNLHTDVDKDQLDLHSRKTGATTTSYGNRRSMVKLTDTTQVAVPNSQNTVSKDMKIELNVSIPVGVPFTEVAELRARLVSFIMDDSNMEALCLAGQIDF